MNILNGGRKATDSRETGWQCMLVYALFLAAQYLGVEVDINVLWAVFAALVGRQGVHAWGNVREHEADAAKVVNGKDPQG